MSAALSGTVGRWQLRDLAKQALLDQTIARRYVYTSRDTAQAENDAPQIVIYSPIKSSKTKGDSPPSFDATVTLVITSVAIGATLAECEEQMDLLHDQIEFALFTNQKFIKSITRVTSVDSTVKHEIDGSSHSAKLTMTIDCEYFDVFGPNLVLPSEPNFIGGNTLTSMTILSDIGDPFDATGDLPNAGTLANGVTISVPPSPRTTGPDGRVEIGADFSFPQS